MTVPGGRNEPSPLKEAMSDCFSFPAENQQGQGLELFERVCGALLNQAS